MKARRGTALIATAALLLAAGNARTQPAPSATALGPLKPSSPEPSGQPKLLNPAAPAASPSSPATPAGAVASSQESKAAAQALFDEGMALRKKGAAAEACAKIEESFRLDAAPGTKFYLAECLEQAGKLASAWLLYTEVGDAMAASGQQKRETFARERSAALAPKLSRLKIAVATAARVPGLVVRRDGAPLGEAQWGFAIPVDSGVHVIDVTAPNARPFHTTVEVREAGSTLAVEIPALLPLAGEVASACPTVVIAAPTTSPITMESPLNATLRRAGLAIGGVGLAGLVIGGVLGGAAVSRQNQSNRGPCDLSRDVCSREGLALREDAIHLATGSTVAFVVGGVMLAAGVVLVALPALRPVQAAVVARANGLALEGRW